MIAAMQPHQHPLELSYLGADGAVYTLRGFAYEFERFFVVDVFAHGPLSWTEARELLRSAVIDRLCKLEDDPARRLAAGVPVL